MKNSAFALLLLLLTALAATPALAQQKTKTSKKDYVVTLSTRLGDIAMVLYEDTPLHRENFLKLVNEKYYDSTTFHRVLKDFMIQGGDPYSKPGGDASQLGRGNPGYTIPAEFRDHYKHIKGALCAARMGDPVNPQKESSGSQFYIVQNEKGTPHLDGAYTIFGRVIRGLDVVDKIANEPVSRSVPVTDIRMTVTAKQLPKKKITKLYGYVYE